MDTFGKWGGAWPPSTPLPGSAATGLYCEAQCDARMRFNTGE